MGRCLSARRSYEAGDLILEDESLVAASRHEDECFECGDEHSDGECEEANEVYDDKWLALVPRFEAELMELPKVGTLDRSRCFLKACHTSAHDEDALAQFLELQPSNLEQCRKSLESMSGPAKQWLLADGGLAEKDAVHILGVLNNNSHQLDSDRGCGLFPLAAMMQHSCAPNCAFHAGLEFFKAVTIRSIESGERLSIDYLNGFYTPTEARAQESLRTFGFACACVRCSTSPDLTRAFRCPHPTCAATATAPHAPGGDASDGRGGGGTTSEDGSGRLCPSGAGLRGSDWRCLRCAEQLSDRDRQNMIAAEETAAAAAELLMRRLLSVAVPSWPSAESVSLSIGGDSLLPSHHIIYHVHLSCARSMSATPRLCRSGEAAAMWAAVLVSADSVIPQWHEERVVLHESVGQMHVAGGHIDLARESFQKALDVSVVCSGADSLSSRQLEMLVEHTPKTVAQLQMLYEMLE